MKQTTVKVLVIPITAKPSQKLSVVLAGQNCQISIYQKSTGLFVDLSVNNSAIFTTKLCRDRLSMTGKQYFGFIGDLYFKDLKGADDPHFSDLGRRYILCHAVPV